MVAVKFYEDVKDELLRFAVVIAKHDGKWVFCKHKERETLEFPGGHRETGETIAETAKRELMEETGAVKFEIRPICVYSVTGKTRVNETGEESFGGLFYAVAVNKGRLEDLQTKQLVVMIVLSMYMGLTSSGVDNAAHVAGLILGILLGILLYRKPKKKMDDGGVWNER